MAKVGPKDVTVTIEDAPGGTARAITNFILEGLEVAIESMMMNTQALGDQWEEHTPIGVRKVDPITLTMLADTTATTGTIAVFADVDDGPDDDGREMVVNYLSSAVVYTFDVRFTKKTLSVANDGLLKLVAELQPTGALVIS